MKIKLMPIIIYTMYTIVGISCSEYNSESKHNRRINNNIFEDSSYRKLMFTKSIVEVDKQIENVGTWKLLFNNNVFMDIYEHPSFYIDSANTFIANDTNTVHQKTVAVYSMQKLNLESYVLMLQNAKDLYFREKIPELLLNRIISPTFGKTKIIIDNYNNYSVQAILKEVKLSSKTSNELKKNLDEILSGEYSKNLKKFEEESGYDD